MTEEIRKDDEYEWVSTRDYVKAALGVVAIFAVVGLIVGSVVYYNYTNIYMCITPETGLVPYWYLPPGEYTEIACVSFMNESVAEEYLQQWRDDAWKPITYTFVHGEIWFKRWILQDTTYIYGNETKDKGSESV